MLSLPLGLSLPWVFVVIAASIAGSAVFPPLPSDVHVVQHGGGHGVNGEPV